MSDRIKALIALGIFTFMSTLDGSIVNIALPTMSKELHVSTSQITWVVTIYLIVISAIVLIFGRLGDLIGKSRIARIGLGNFYFRLCTCWVKFWLGLRFSSFCTGDSGYWGVNVYGQPVLELFQKFSHLKVEQEHFPFQRCLYRLAQSLDLPLED